MKEYTYYAFISYKREDESWAKWMQDKLERYKLPTANEATGKEYLRPVFRDITDLRPGVLSERIKEALDKSKFLIAICSPMYSKSIWCDAEIQRFIETGKARQIIPFIIDGTPYSDDCECFPPSLKQLRGTEYELLGADVRPINRDYAFVQVVASMLDVNVDSLWKRYLRNEELEKQKIKEQNDRLLTLQSKVIASKAMSLIENWPFDEQRAGDLILAALPIDVDYPERPWLPEAEYVLRSIVKDKLIECKLPDMGGIICYSKNYCICSGKSGPVDVVNGAKDIEYSYSVRIYKTGNHQPIVVDFAEYIDGATISSDEQYLAISTTSRLIVYDIENQSEVVSFAYKGNRCKLVKFSHDKRYVACASVSTIEIFDIKSGNRASLSEHSCQITSIDFDKSQNIFISSSLDKKVIIWDTDGFKVISEFTFDTQVTYVGLDLSKDNMFVALDYAAEKKIVIKTCSISNYGEKRSLILREESLSISKLQLIEDLNMLVVENVSGVHIYDLCSGLKICSYCEARNFQIDETERELSVVETGPRKNIYQIMSKQQILECAKSKYAISNLSTEDKTYFCIM